MRVFLMQVFCFSILWIVFVLIFVGISHVTFNAFIGIGMFGIIGGCAIHAIFNFFRATEKQRKTIAAISMSILVMPPLTYIFYRSYLSLKNDPRTQACGEIVDTGIKLATPNVKDHDRYYMHVHFPEDSFSRRLEVSEGQFYRYAVVSHQVCVIYIREEDMSFGSYNRLMAITSD